MRQPEITRLMHDALAPHEGRDVREITSTGGDVTLVDDEGFVWRAPVLFVGRVEPGQAAS